MKRHKSIIALSQDHHHGLILAQLIKSGAPEYKGLPNDTAGKLNYALTAWENELKKHFENEENILFPFIKGKDNLLDDIVKEILSEHKQIESLFDELKQNTNIDYKLNETGIALEAHIRKEERVLFKKIQEVFSENELNELAGRIQPVKEGGNNSC